MHLCVGERPVVAHLEIDGTSVAVTGQEGEKGFPFSRTRLCVRLKIPKPNRRPRIGYTSGPFFTAADRVCVCRHAPYELENVEIVIIIIIL